MSNRIPLPEEDTEVRWPPKVELTVDAFCQMTGRSRDDGRAMVGPKWWREPSVEVSVPGHQMGLF